MNLSVILCTHNPRQDYLRRTLEGLRTQSLPVDQWELLLIDNASKEPLAGKFDISWHPRSRHIHEGTIGLTAARMRGIRESVGGLLVCVDDDNELCRGYLADAAQIARSHPFLGVFGAACIEAEFEVEPEPWSRPFLPMLALRSEADDIWSNNIKRDAKPYGAGLCIRRDVAEAFVKRAEDDPRRLALGRRGASLASCEDYDITKSATELGLGFGIFASLRVKHLIAKQRLTKDYLLRLQSGMGESHALLYYLWHGKTPTLLVDTPSLRQRVRRLIKGKNVYEEFRDAEREGQLRSLEIISRMARQESPHSQ
jgi:glycosyltransferase involved in cell wall biosynthesis